MTFGELLTTIDAGFGLIAVFMVMQQGATLRRVARRLNVVESRSPVVAAVTDIKSGPVRRAGTTPL